MKVFIGWPGEAGKALAYRVNEWFPSVVPEVEPLYSPAIPGGAARFRKLADMLEQAEFGIVCLTPEADQSPWLEFEAGALWQRLDDARVVPLIAGLAPGKITGPLAQLQVKQFERRDVRSVFKQIAEITGLEQKRFELNFETAWPSLERDVTNDLSNHGISL